MATAHVQTQLGSASGVTKVTTGNMTTTSGNLVVVACSTDPGANFSSVSDSNVNTWTANASSPQTYSGSRRSMQYYAKSITGGAGANFSANASGSTDMSIFAMEISGADTTAPADKNAGAVQTSTGSVATGVTATRSQAAEILVCSFFTTFSNIVSVTAGAGFTVPTNGSILTGANGAPGGIEYQVVSATGTDQGAATLGASPTGVGSIIGTYKAAAAASGGGPIEAGGSLTKGALVRGGRLVA